MKKLRLLFATAFCLLLGHCYAQDTLQVKNIEAILYSGEGSNLPLVVGLGGSEGGNAWASNHWKATRNQFLQKGYAFLAIGYFGSEGTPPILNKIELEDVHNAITLALSNAKVAKGKVALVGGSRGADLALLLASHYHYISCVVALVPSHAVFPGHTQEFNTSCWTYQGKELPFIPVNEEAVPFLIEGNLRGTFEAMLKDTLAEQKALIKVEKIKGPVLLLSATRDEVSPSTPMSEKMISRLRAYQFPYPYKHLAIEGGHAEPLKHFDQVFRFLDENYKN